jgi:hypothetical protein
VTVTVDASGRFTIHLESPRPQAITRSSLVPHGVNRAESRAVVLGEWPRLGRDIGWRRCERGTVTPAMKRIEAEDPERRLAGLEHSLKGKDRLTQKINEAVDERGRTVEQAFAMVKDAIRYTFCYPEDRYAEGIPDYP